MWNQRQAAEGVICVLPLTNGERHPGGQKSSGGEEGSPVGGKVPGLGLLYKVCHRWNGRDGY